MQPHSVFIFHTTLLLYNLTSKQLHFYTTLRRVYVYINRQNRNKVLYNKKTIL